jgi:hypothetical protein
MKKPSLLHLGPRDYFLIKNFKEKPRRSELRSDIASTLRNPVGIQTPECTKETKFHDALWRPLTSSGSSLFAGLFDQLPKGGIRTSKR